MENFENLDFYQTLVRTDHPSGLERAVRVRAPEDIGEGFEDGFPLRNKCLLVTRQLKAKCSFSEVEPGGGRLVFWFHLSGRRTFELPGIAKHELDMPSFVVFWYPEGVEKVGAWTEGFSHTDVSIGFNLKSPPEHLESFLPTIVDVIGGSPASTNGCVFFQRPLTPAMHGAARATVSPNVHAALLADYLQSKATELLCLGIGAILNDSQKDVGARNAGMDVVLNAKAIIDESPNAPVSVDGVSRRLGISQKKLSRLFSAHVGCSMTEYSTQIRMDRSVELLITTDRPVKQIAYEAGYNHTSNFCIAFKRRFGITPQEARDKGKGFASENAATPAHE